MRPSASSAARKDLTTHLKYRNANANSGGISTMLISVMSLFMRSMMTSATTIISTERNISIT